MQNGAGVQPEQLRELLLFEGLPSERLAWCSSLLEEVEIPAGESVCGRGSIPHSFFVVVLGNVDILVDLQPAASMRTGQFWHRPESIGDSRSFVAIAADDCFVARALPWNYRALRAGLPVIAERIDETIGSRAALLESN